MRQIAVAAVLCLSAATAYAQADLMTPRSLGMGEAARATATGADAPILNPAGMSLVKQYVIEGFYGFSVEDVGHRVHVSVVDSVTSRVAAALFYTFVYTSPKVGFNWAGGQVPSATTTRTGHAAGLSLSLRLGDYFMLGFTTKYLHMDTTAPLPAGTQPSQLTFDTVNGVTFDVGALVHIGDKFNITAIGYNLWDHGSRESPLSMAIGLAYTPLPVLTIGFDTVINFTGNQQLNVDPSSGKRSYESRTTVRLGPGIQWVISNKVPVRAGYVFDSELRAGKSNPAGSSYLTVGLGYQSPQFGIDLGYRGKVDGGKDNILEIGARLFVN
jgi:hypothetical protein